jgi:hypothetical protein
MPVVTPGNRHGRAFPQVPSDSRPLRQAKRRRRASSAIGEFAADERGGKFSAAQSLENSENAERISLRESLIRSTRRAVPRLPGNGAQRLEKIESAPENGMASESRTHNIWYTGAWLTVRSGELISEPRLRPSGHSSRIRSAVRWEIFRLATP